MQQVVFKSELRDFDLARSICRHQGALCATAERQVDVCFRMPTGRLIRRRVPRAAIAVEPSSCETTEVASDDAAAVWIRYHRANRSQPTLCSFSILSQSQAASRWGTMSLQPWAYVTKDREVWSVDHARIHLDRVENIGCFIEIAAELCEKYDQQECEMIVDYLRNQLRPVLGEPISQSYSELAVPVA
ncbi:MAG: CYTH domain-containing protein [Phycisphaerales bacterium]